jgi:hypothetical protein
MSEAFEIHELSAIDCAFEPVDWAFPREEKAWIAEHWAGLKARKPALFDGRVLLLHRFAIEDGVFRGAYLETSYSTFIAFRDRGFPDPGKRNCFAMAALSAADGPFLLGEMGPHTANAGAVYFAAGTPDPSDVVGDRVDLEGSVLRELEEETGLSAGEVDVAPGWTAVMGDGRIALMKPVKARLPAEALRRRILAFLAEDAEPELAGVHLVDSPQDILVDRIPAFQQAFLRYAFARRAGKDQRTG